MSYAWFDGADWQSTVIDDAETSGTYNSVAILPSGEPAVSYYQRSPSKDLKYAWREDGIWHSITVDGGAGSYWSTSLAVLPMGEPAMALSGGINEDLRFSRLQDGTWLTTVVDSDLGDSRADVSLAVLPTGYPAIGYCGNNDNSLKYAWQDATGWHNIVVVATAAHGLWDPSLAVLPSGQPAICYLECCLEPTWSGAALHYAWNDGENWNFTQVDTLAYQLAHPSLVVLPSGQPAVVYWHEQGGLEPSPDDGLKYAWLDGDTWQITTIDYGIHGDLYAPSMAILPSGYPAISYLAPGDGPFGVVMKYAWFNGKVWQSVVVEDQVRLRDDTSLAILPSGNPAIAYYDASEYVPRYAWYDGEAWHTTTVGDGGGTQISMAILPSGLPAMSFSHGDHLALKYAVGVVTGDIDNNSLVDLSDYAVFIDCMAGAQAMPDPTTPPTTRLDCLDTFDFDVDNDVDLKDFSAFQSRLLR